jgi:acyl carrier protein
MTNKKWLVKTLININPEIKKFINKKNFNLINNGIIDSLMIVRLVYEIEKRIKKKINISKIKREVFFNIESIERKFFNEK